MPFYKNKTSIALTSNKDRCMLISKLKTRLCKFFLILSFTNMLAFLSNATVVIVAKIFPETGLSIKSYNMKMVMFGGNILRVINSLTIWLFFCLFQRIFEKKSNESYYSAKKVKREIFLKVQHTPSKQPNVNNMIETIYTLRQKLRATQYCFQNWLF
jgi:hypothetical protein